MARSGYMADTTAWTAMNNICRTQRAGRRQKEHRRKKQRRERKIIDWQNHQPSIILQGAKP